MNQNITYPGPQSGLGPIQWLQKQNATLQEENTELKKQIELLKRQINSGNNTIPLANTAANPNILQNTNRSLASRIAQTLVSVTFNSIKLYTCYFIALISFQYFTDKPSFAFVLLPLYYTFLDYIISYRTIQNNAHGSFISIISHFIKNYTINNIKMIMPVILISLNYTEEVNVYNVLILLAIYFNISNYIVDNMIRR